MTSKLLASKENLPTKLLYFLLLMNLANCAHTTSKISNSYHRDCLETTDYAGKKITTCKGLKQTQATSYEDKIRGNSKLLRPTDPSSQGNSQNSILSPSYGRR